MCIWSGFWGEHLPGGQDFSRPNMLHGYFSREKEVTEWKNLPQNQQFSRLNEAVYVFGRDFEKKTCLAITTFPDQTGSMDILVGKKK